MELLQAWLGGALAGLGMAASAGPEQNWLSLVATQPRTTAPIYVDALAASRDGWWLVDRRSRLHRVVAGQSDPAVPAVALGFHDSRALFATPGDGLLLLGTRGRCISSTSECETAIEGRDGAGLRQWTIEVAGRCGVPDFAADGSFRLACAGRLYDIAADGKALRQQTVFSNPALLDGDHRALPEGGLLLVARSEAATAIAALDAGGRTLWQSSFARRSAPPQFSDTHLYLHFPVQAGLSAVTVLRSSDGAISGHVQLPDEISAAQSWQGLLWLGLVDAAGQHRLQAMDPAGAVAGTLALGDSPVKALGLTQSLSAPGDELVLGLDGELPSLARLDRSGGFRQRSLGAASAFGALATLPDGQVVVSSTPLQADPQSRQIEVLDGLNQRVGLRLERLPAPLDSTARSTIDVDSGELWSVGIQQHPYLARQSYDGQITVVARFENLQTPYSQPLSAPVATADHYCAALSNGRQIFCAPRHADASAYVQDLPIEADEPIRVLAADAAGRLVVLSERTIAGRSQLLRSVVTPDGLDEQVTGAFVPAGFRSLGGLRSLMGERLLVDGERAIAEVVPTGRRLQAAAGLPDGGAILATVADQDGDPVGGRLERIDALGGRLWAVDLPAGLLPARSRLSLAVGPQVVLVEPVSNVIFAVPKDPQRGLFDLDSGQLLASEAAYYDSQLLAGTGPPPFLDVSGGPAGGFWRLSENPGGIIAQRIAAGGPKQHFWLPCACSLRAATTSSDGLLYLALQRGHEVLLGIADPPSLVATRVPPNQLDRGRLHADGVLLSGLLTGTPPGAARPLSLRIEHLLDTRLGRFVAEWSYLEASGVGERTLDFDRRRPALTAVDDSIRLADNLSLLPLLGPAWLIKEQGDFLGDPQAAAYLQARADSQGTRSYFSSEVDDYWIAIDEGGREGIWALPDGRWYRLQQEGSGRWTVHAVDSPQARMDRPADPADLLGTGQLLRAGCSTVSWRLQTVERTAQRALGSELGALRQLHSGDCGR